ncbi:MAG: hypothetical protein KAI66_10695, partial [Lentisphaeria bacterium]|nr:hypothetical protein [Lentisphaeria bacterium]
MSTHNRYFLVAVLTLVGALLQATELSLGLNGSFEETVTSKDGTTTPKCWMFNSAFRKNGSWGTVAYAEGQHSLGITAQRGPVHVFTSVGFSAAPGQPFTITTDVRGKGAFKVWLYCYGDAGWVGGNVSSAEKQVDAEKWQSMVFQLAIPTTPFPKGEVRSIKLALDVAKGAALQFDNLTLVTETKMKPTQTNAGGEMLRLYLPPVIHAVPGIECNLYFDNTLLVVNPANYVFDVSCAKGTQQQERWTFMPSDADVGDCVFTLAVRDGANAVLAKAETLLRVVPGDSLQKLSILMVGDSLTHASMYPSHVAKLAAADKKMDLTLVGSHQPKKELPLARHEGYGGWTAKNFTTRFRADPEGYRASSPFLYEGADGKPVLDFPRYCRENNGDKIPDIVTIFLGPNDIFHADDET